MSNHRNRKAQRGFTLVEVLVSMVILVIGALSLAGFFAQGLGSSSQTQMQYIAQQKAQAAMESIFTARDTKILTFSQIKNVSQGGVFLDGPQMLCDPGVDGLYGTQDDNTALPDSIVVGPGTDGIFGTADDTVLSLNPWMKRTIAIVPVAGTPNLEQITVTVQWNYEGQKSQYVLVSYISNFS